MEQDSSIGAVDVSTAKHDPLCDFRNNGDWADVCDECRLIARVREDMLDRYAIRTSSWQQGYDVALLDAVEAVKVAAVRKDTSHDMRAVAVAAIEALGGER